MEICATITNKHIKNPYHHSRSEHPLKGNMFHHYIPGIETKTNISPFAERAPVEWKHVPLVHTKKKKQTLNGNMFRIYIPTKRKHIYRHSRSEHPLNGNMFHYYIPQNQKYISPFAERAPVEWKYVVPCHTYKNKIISLFAERAPVE